MSDSESSIRLNEYRCASSRQAIQAVYIFDTAAFLSALQLHIYSGRIVSTPSVIREVKDAESTSRLETALSIRRVEVEQPLPEYIEKAKKVSKNAKILEKLSQADIEVVALAIEYRDRGAKPIVFTDDYDVQKVLSILGIEFRSVKNLGIDRPR